MADVIKNSYTETNHHTKVLFQRGKNVMDYELNEMQDNLRILGARAASALADSGVRKFADLRVTGNGTNGTLTIAATTSGSVGGLMVDGTLVRLEANDTSVSVPTDAATHKIYAIITETEITDPNLQTEVGETTRRTKYQMTFARTTGLIPTDTANPIWAGGTRYIYLADVQGVAAVVTATHIVDRRTPLLPYFVNPSVKEDGTGVLTITGDLTITGKLTAALTNVSALSILNWTKRTGHTLGTSGGAGISGIGGKPDGSLIVALGHLASPNTLNTSQNGVRWTARTTPNGVSAQTMFDVEWNGSLWIAVGAGGVVWSSSDAVTWTARTSGTANDLYAVAWGAGPGLWVAVGDSQTIITSPDGITWTTRTSALTGSLRSVAYSTTAATYCIGLLANGTSNHVQTSTNGTAWTGRTVTGLTSGSGGAVQRNGVAFFTGGTVGVGTGLFFCSATIVAGGSQIATSPDGITWTVRSTLTQSVSNTAFGFNGVHVVLVATAFIHTSSDGGLTWVNRLGELWTDAVGNGVQDVYSYLNGAMIAVGGDVTVDMLYQSLLLANS